MYQSLKQLFLSDDGRVDRIVFIHTFPGWTHWIFGFTL